jgi:hypothetical protein
MLEMKALQLREFAKFGFDQGGTVSINPTSVNPQTSDIYVFFCNNGDYAHLTSISDDSGGVL